MSIARPFIRQTPTFAVSVGATATTPVNIIPAAGSANVTSYVIQNTGASRIYFKLGTDNTVTATVPAPGTPADVTPLAGGQAICVTGPSNAWLAAIGEVAGPVTMLAFAGDGNLFSATGNA